MSDKDAHASSTSVRYSIYQCDIKFSTLSLCRELIEKHGVCFRVLGNLRLLPDDIQQIIARAVEMTKHNNK